jgi:hypothetical protein
MEMERIYLCRQNIGFIVLVTYPSVSALPSTETLSQGIDQLLVALPLLTAEVVGRQTPKPYFAPRTPGWTAKDILRDDQFDTWASESGTATATTQAQRPKRRS